MQRPLPRTLLTIAITASITWAIAFLRYDRSRALLNSYGETELAYQRSNKLLLSDYDRMNWDFVEKTKRPELAVKAEIWKPRFDSIYGMTSSTFRWLTDIRMMLLQEADLSEEDLPAVLEEERTSVVRKVITEKDMEQQIMDTIRSLAERCERVMPEGFKRKLPLLPWRSDTIYKDPSLSFKGRSLAGALALLNRVRNDVLFSGNSVLNLCYENVNSVVFSIDKIELLISQNATVLAVGDDLVIKAGIGAFSSAAKPMIRINGQTMPINDSGFVIYRIPIRSAKDGSIPVSISYKDPNTGQNMTKTTEVSYKVFQK